MEGEFWGVDWPVLVARLPMVLAVLVVVVRSLLLLGPTFAVEALFVVRMLLLSESGAIRSIPNAVGFFLKKKVECPFRNAKPCSLEIPPVRVFM